VHEVLGKNLFLVKEHVGMFKAANNYDIYDPENNRIIMECREDSLGVWTKLFRFTKYKRMTPFDVRISLPGGGQLVRVTRGISIFLSKVTVLDENDSVIGGFRQRFSLGGSFDVLDKTDTVVCSLKGKWTGWDFRFEYQGQVFAQVNKKWAGLGKELFTSADNYVLSISETVSKDNPVRQLILGAIMCIDMVLKE